MIKRYFLIIICFFFINNVYAFDIKNINKSKIVSQASYSVNDTNLVDKENAQNLLGNVEDLNEAISSKEKEIQKNNKDRSQPKFKGAEDIFVDFSKSVVFIGNRKNKSLKGVGSGFVIRDKGNLKITTNWHVIDGADSLSVWTEPTKMVDENFLISQIDSFTAKIIKVNKTKDLAMLEVEQLPLNVKTVRFGKFSKDFKYPRKNI